jgi:hypothetical protein
MMYGYADDWTALLYALALLWALFGPFVMAGLGIACGRARGGRSRRVVRVCSVVVPLIAVGVPAVARFKPDDVPPTQGDVTGFLAVYVGLLTVLPWLLAYGITRLVVARRARRARPAP